METNQSEISHADSDRMANRISTLVHSVYQNLSAEQSADLIQKIGDTLEEFSARYELPPQNESSTNSASRLWSENDVVLITYADQVSDGETPTLETLRKFLEGHCIADAINLVHLLPFYPYSSDDGFSVIDYYDLAPGIGSWEDVEQLNQSVDLMFDLVLNHCSKHNVWFKKFQMGDPDYANYFHVVPEDTDVSLVTRPRSLPLLSPFPTTEGTKHVWTTFSDDQVDLNFAEPAVLLEFIRVLLFYIEQGARIVRLDAVAFLWKSIGTTCIHLRETHEVIKLLRDVLDQVAPHVILLTETNVPHAENVSYFGDGDEAHMVYQFSLPPLLLDAFVHEDAMPLRDWLLELDPPPQGTTFFNFGASHDGIGVRPLEGLLEPERIDSLVQKIRERGGLVGTRRKPDGTDSPYELNISYFDAIVGNPDLDSETQVRKFLSTQAIILSLPGIPGIYFHSLVGTPNDSEAAAESGIPRRINRRKYGFEELTGILNDKQSVQSKLFEKYLELIKTRTSQAAFHPQGGCKVWSKAETESLGDPRLLVFERTSISGDQKVLVVINPTADSIRLNLSPSQSMLNVVSQETFHDQSDLVAYGFLWLSEV